MKTNFLIPFLFFSLLHFSQKKVTKKYESQLQEIEISTVGLDDLVIENSNSKYIEITLFAENAAAQHVIFREEDKAIKIDFSLDSIKNDANKGTCDTLSNFNSFDEGSEVMSKEANVQLAIRQENFIRHLKNALIRIENKTYGVFRVTRKLIQKGRLKLVSHAALSIEAKRKQ